MSCRNLRQSIVHRLITLGIPYLLCSVLYWCIKYMASFFVAAPVSLQDLLWIFIKPIEFFWYLYALLIIYILADIIGYFYGNKTVLFLVFLLAAAFFQPQEKLYVLNKVIPHITFFYLGCVLRKYSREICSAKVILTSGILFAAAAYVYLNHRSGELKLLVAASSTCFLMGVFARMESTGKDTFLSRLGQRAMPIYIIHVILVGGIRILLMRAGIHQLGIHMVFGFFIPLVICYWAYDLIKKVPVLDFIFYPGSYIRVNS